MTAFLCGLLVFLSARLLRSLVDRHTWKKIDWLTENMHEWSKLLTTGFWVTEVAIRELREAERVGDERGIERAIQKYDEANLRNKKLAEGILKLVPIRASLLALVKAERIVGSE